MSKKNLFKQMFWAVICLFAITNLTWSQETNDAASRSINSLDFQAQRPKTVGAKAGGGASSKSATKVSNARRRKNIAVVSNARRRYNLVKRIAAVKPKISPPIKTGDSTKNPGNANPPLKNEELGVTFWRMRPLESDEEDAPTFPVKINNQTENWTAERVGSTTKFQKGDRVRFTIESSRSGFLYIVNREFYADGTSAEADLIFPTLRTRGGDNRVTAGSLIEIPASSDSVSYFTVKPKREDYAGEEILVIISPQKIPGIEPGLRAQTITRAKVQKWLEDWGATVDIYDAEDGEGIAYTTNEAEASTTQSRALTQEEPLPQTIYRVQARADAPLLVPFRMLAKTP